MRVVCVGGATLDTIVCVESYPAADERVEALDLVEAGGGAAATAAVAMARLGLDVAFVGAVGTDAAGTRIRAGLVDERVDVSLLVQIPDTRSARSVVIVDRHRGSRAIANLPPPRTSWRARKAAVETCLEADWVHADQWGYPVLAEAAAHRSSWSGRPLLSLDAGNPVPDLELSGIDLFVPTEQRLLDLYPGMDLKEAMLAARADGAGRVVVTSGARGSAALGHDGVLCAPAFSVPIVSTLGAGDVFHGALIASLAVGRQLSEALLWANAAAALSCRALDGRSAIPDQAELKANVEDTTKAR